MKVFRFAALAWVAAAGLFVLSMSTRAQENEPVLTEKTYDISGLTRSDFERSPRSGGIGDVLAPDLLFSQGGYDPRIDRWSLRHSGDEARCWDEWSSVIDQVCSLCNTEGEPLDYRAGQPGKSTTVKVNATEEVHRRIHFVLTALRDMARARVGIKVFRLDPKGDVAAPWLTPQQAASAQKSAKLVGTLHGGLGERLVLQRLQHRSYVSDYDVSVATGAASPYSQVRDLRTGEEIVAGAIVLPGGKLWIQAWHAAMKLDDMRKFDTNCGQIELPRAAYTYTPLSVVMGKGSGAILDAGLGGRFMLVADCDSLVENRRLELPNGGALELHNLAGVLLGQGPEARWVMTPNVNRVTADGVPLDQVFLDEPIDGPYNDAAIVGENWLSNQEGFGDGVAYEHVGPFLAIRSRPPVDDEEGIKLQAQNFARLQSALKAFSREPEGAVVRVRSWAVASGTALPDGIIDGKPSEKDLGVMESMGAPSLDRATAAMVGQGVDFMDLTLATHLRDYQTVLAQQATGVDPQIGVLVLGKQVHWMARGAGEGKLRIEVRAAVTIGNDRFEQIPWGEEKKWSIERSLSDLAQADMAGELAVGEAMASVCPTGSDDKLLVMVVQRVK